MEKHFVRLGGDLFNTDNPEDLALAVTRIAAGDASGNICPAEIVTEHERPIGWVLQADGSFTLE